MHLDICIRTQAQSKWQETTEPHTLLCFMRYHPYIKRKDVKICKFRLEESIKYTYELRHQTI